MKLLFSLYRHFTEVVFPALAARFNWPTCHEKDIKERICNALGIRVPIYPSRRQTQIQDLKRLVDYCYKINDNPWIFLFI